MAVLDARESVATGGRGRLAAGAVGLFCVLIYLNEIRSMRLGTAADPGPALFPLVVGLAFAAVSVAVMVAELRVLRKPAPADQGDERTEARGRREGRRELLILTGSFIAYAILLPHLGHFTATLLFCLVFLRGVGRLTWIRTLIWSVVFSAGVHVLFAGLFGVRLPIGLISI